jgi:type IV pilus assembly protein PilX
MTNMKKKANGMGLHCRQRGAVLVIGLIMLLLMTIVGLASVRGSNMQELMAGNMRDSQVSFQASESGLRAPEIVAGANTQPNTSAAVGALRKADVNGGSLSFWQAYEWAGSSPKSVDTLLALGSNATPRYVIEELDVALIPGADGRGVDEISVRNTPEPVLYRITARGEGKTASAVTFLQTMYRRQ